MTILTGATYKQTATGEEARLLAARSKRVILENSSGAFEVARIEFDENYELTNKHDHDNYCCGEHSVHVSPHRGCILR